jgi:hypothetical protein
MRKIQIGGLAVTALALMAGPGAMTAPAKDGDVKVRGACTKASESKIKLSPEDGGIEVEFEVDQNRNGRTWHVVIKRNGVVAKRLTKVTRGPSGSFEARIVTGNSSGRDSFTAVATRPGETCTARASI